jgi:hypothetical protein
LALISEEAGRQAERRRWCERNEKKKKNSVEGRNGKKRSFCFDLMRNLTWVRPT